MQREIDFELSIDHDVGTGRAFIVRDKGDVRLLVNSATNANYFLSESEIGQCEQAIRSSRVLDVSGFCVKGSCKCRVIVRR